MKQPLLLLHGAISSCRQFDMLLPFLDDRFEVHALNFPGHGGTEIPGQPFSIPYFASSVLDYLDQKKISLVDIFGYSMGGYVALYLAAYHAGPVKKIFTLATKMEWTRQIAEKEAAHLNPGKISEKVPAFAALLERTHYPQSWEKVVRQTAAMLLQLGNSPVIGKNNFREIEIPVLIAIGDEDKMVSYEESKNAASSLKNGQLLLMPSTPHPFEKVNHSLLSGYINNFF
jgi:pimeloyl-ACP methyl ester carboxylesterase